MFYEKVLFQCIIKSVVDMDSIIDLQQKKMKNTLLFCSILLFASCTSNEIQLFDDCPDILHTKTGTIKDFYSSEPIVGLEVCLLEGSTSVSSARTYCNQTDSNGIYHVSGNVANCFNSGGNSNLIFEFPENYNAIYKDESNDHIFLYLKKNVPFVFIKSNESLVTWIAYKIETDINNYTPNTVSNPIQYPIHKDGIDVPADSYIKLLFKTDLSNDWEEEMIYIDPNQEDFSIIRHY